MKKLLATLSVFLVVAVITFVFFLVYSGKKEKINNKSLVMPELQLEAMAPETFSTQYFGSYVISDSNFELEIARALFSDDPSKTGGDYCGGGGAQKEQLTQVGSLEGKIILRKDGFYYSPRASIYCTSMPIFTKKYPDYDGIKVNFTFKSPDLSDLEKQKYTQIADQIVLSLKDTAKQ